MTEEQRRSGHVAITGGNSGIGAALARLHAGEGRPLTLIARNAERLEQVAAACRALGAPEVETAAIDVTEEERLRAYLLARDAQRPIMRLYVNAGGGAPEGPDRAARITALNVDGARATAEALMGSMQTRRMGEIVLISSLASFFGLKTAPAYAAAKAWLRIWGEGMRPHLAKNGVALNVVCPGFVDTPLVQNNPWPMPLIMSADDAAARIARGVARNQARIAFPRRMYWLARLASALPPDLASRLIGERPNKESD